MWSAVHDTAALHGLLMAHCAAVRHHALLLAQHLAIENGMGEAL
jgi:hypothetical protein